MRLHSYIKNYGNYTKSELLKLFENNKILVNNEIKSLSYIVRENDFITVDGRIIDKIPYVYYLYNKPKGLICSNDNKPDSYVKYIDIECKVYCVGRLDKDSHGLLILTNDGTFSHKIKENVQKEYIVKVKNIIDDDFINKINNIKELDNKLLKSYKVSIVDDYTFNIILNEGMYHQIRRMVKMSNNYVVDLKRIRIGEYKLGDLSEGKIKKIEV